MSQRKQQVYTKVTPPSQDDSTMRSSTRRINPAGDVDDTEDEFAQHPTGLFISRTFKKRMCKRFVKDKKDKSDSLVCSCGHEKKQHIATCTFDQPNEPWKVEHDTVEYPTDAFGELEFVTTGQKICKYVRTEYKTNIDNLLELMRDHWNMELPNLLISVTGGAQNFTMKPRLKEVFRQGLVKAAETTRAWIITGGTNAGVMKHVGEAVRDYTLKCGNKKPLVALGIATWGCIENNDDLRSLDADEPYTGRWPASYKTNETTKKNETPLDPNHTHFILVDDGTRHKFGVEIDLRAKLESAVSAKKTAAANVSIPVVCVVLEGGPNTIETVRKAIDAGTPAIIVAGSGRAADILAYAYNKCEEIEIDVKDELNQKQLVPLYHDNLWEEVKELIKKEFKVEGDKLKSIADNVQACINKIDHVTVFSLDGGGEAADIDITILKALLKVNRGKRIDQLRLALAWNRIDVARDEIYNEGVRFEDQELHDLMFNALLNDRVEFVKLLLEKGIDLKKFLTIERLTELYNEDTTKERCRHLRIKNEITLKHVGFFMKDLIGELFEPSYCHQKFSKQKPTKKSGLSVPMVLKDINPVPYDSGHEFEDPCKELFIWCILTRMKEMAMVFWYEGKEDIALSLLANLMLKSLLSKEQDTEFTQDLQDQVNFFEELATGLLAECYSTDPSNTMFILVREMPNFGETTALKLAVQADNKSFIAHPACQTLLTDIWTGYLAEDNHYVMYLISVFLFPFAPLLLKYRDKERKLKLEGTSKKTSKNKGFGKSKPLTKIESKSSLLNANTSTVPSPNVTDSTKSSNICANYWKKLVSFFRAPCIKFAYNCMSYFSFLLLFGVILLTDFFPTIRVKEEILIAWLVTMIVEEVRQVAMDDAGDVRLKLYNYINDVWNVLDVITIVTFLTGMILRFIPVTICGQCFYAARIILALNLMTFFFRILNMFSIHRQLGPKLVMIGQMMIDLFYFMIVLMVFIAAYGVASNAILYPNQPLNIALARDVLSQPWWDVLQQFNLDDISGNNCVGPLDGPYSGEDCASLDYDAFNETCIDNKANKCPAINWLVPIILAIYALITNVMMLNLLIAMFSNTFAELQGQTNVIWKMQRYHLVREYDSRPFLPPPFIVIVHAFLFIRYVIRHTSSSDCCCWNFCKKNTHAFGFRMTFNSFEEKNLENWENLNAEEYLRKTEADERETADNKAKETNKRVDVILRKVEEIADTNFLLRSSNSDTQAKLPSVMEDRLQYLEKQMQRTSKALDWIIANMARMGSPGVAPHLPDVDSQIQEENEERQRLRKEKVDLIRNELKQRAGLHKKSRDTLYPAQKPFNRFQVPDNYVSFEIPYPEYQPDTYSENDDAGLDFTKSWLEQEYKVVDGLPQNPKGRTGLRGKGILDHWGPNHVANVVITRWKKGHHPKVLEFISVVRTEEVGLKIPAIPEAPATCDDYRSAVHECFKRVLENVNDDVEKLLTNNEKAIGRRDYLDDHRNTDNAWLETITLNYHIEDFYDKITIKNCKEVSWSPIRSSVEVYGSHLLLLKRVAGSFNEATF